MMEPLLKVRSKLGPYIRLSIPYTAWWALDRRGESILDVGCGKGWFMSSINKHGHFFSVGADIFQPYIKECKRQGIHDGHVLCDVRMLPFQRKSFDIVLCLEVLEHLEKEEGKTLLNQLEEIGRRQVIISTPGGVCRQQAYDGNPYQEHKSSWSAAELRYLGYQVRGFGFQGMYGEQGLRSNIPKIAIPFAHIIWGLSSLFTFFFPALAGDIVCIKKLKS
jgi:SAM-dependent methyltransferase